jgi:hypothetical protein
MQNAQLAQGGSRRRSQQGELKPPAGNPLHHRVDLHLDADRAGRQMIQLNPAADGGPSWSMPATAATVACSARARTRRVATTGTSPLPRASVGVLGHGVAEGRPQARLQGPEAIPTLHGRRPAVPPPQAITDGRLHNPCPGTRATIERRPHWSDHDVIAALVRWRSVTSGIGRAVHHTSGSYASYEVSSGPRPADRRWTQL